MTSLGTFLRNELHRRDWSVEEFARRCVPPISTTLGYQVLDGKDNVKRKTFNSMAAALGMTPAELMVVIGGGGGELTPDEIEALAAYRRVAPDKRSTALDMLHWLAESPLRADAVTSARRLVERSEGSPLAGLAVAEDW